MTRRAGVGRPRIGPPRRAGATASEEILDAAAELFATHGYAATSTRMIAAAVGIRQASLYHHFASKEQMLAELLDETVRPSLERAAELEGSDEPADRRLHALVAYDVSVLCGARWNTGALYLLPEVRTARFDGFRAERARLRATYRRLVEAGCEEGCFAARDVEVATDLVFGLVESVIPLRAERGSLDAAGVSAAIADACLRVVGLGTAGSIRRSSVS